MRTKEERGSHNIPARAVEWFAKSAERGNPNAQDMLGKLYLAGKGVPRDEEKAAQASRP